MNKAIRTRHFRATVTRVLLTALFLLAALVFVLQPVATTSDRGGAPAIHATNADGGGSSFTDDPYIDRHAQVVARYHEGSIR